MRRRLPHRNKAFLLIGIMVFQLSIPQNGLALSGGNKAPEFESFQPFGLDNMVDPATGDFSYNIPLMNVGFHGINLFYQAGITMDQEATMVGLGWNINSGMINRTVRGIPDDFKGDRITKKMSTKPYTTVGFRPGLGIETFGIDGLGLSTSMGVYSNSYNGLGFEFSIAPSYSISALGDGVLTAGVGLSASSDGGATLSPSLSFSTKYNKEKNRHEGSGIGIGSSINSRGGLKALSLSGNLKLKEKVNIIPQSFSGSISFAKPSYVPSIQFPQKSSGFTMDAAIDFAAYGVAGEVTGTGYFSQQKINQKVVEVEAYGLFYHEYCGKSDLQDFHRANDIPQSEDVPDLALPVLDYDVYSVSGPGISGTMQLHRGDVGLVYDRELRTTSVDGSVGVEFGLPFYSHVGGDIITNTSTQEVNKWEANFTLNDQLSFKGKEANQLGFENAYFKMSNDGGFEGPRSDDLFGQIKGFEPIRPRLQNAGPLEYMVAGPTKSLTSTTPHNLAVISGQRSSREKRSNNITSLSFAEARNHGFSNYLFDHNDGFFNHLLGMGHVQSHHLAEFIVDNEDGFRYIYGLPVYNLNQVEETFSVAKNSSNYELSKNLGLVDIGNFDRSFQNKNGKDNYYSFSQLPPYVTTHLLTAIVSSDYQDLTGDGPSPDDYGDYVQFNYQKVQNYNWKTPTSENSKSQASLSAGFISEPDDDKGHVVYGEREQYRPLTIANKTDIVVYEYYDTIDRADAFEEIIDGTKDPTKAIKALRTITKYNLQDYVINGDQAEKIKSVHFEYDYSLCPGVYNGTDGKLTLKKLYILNGESWKGRFSPYQFHYAQDGATNYPYQPKAVNRFGGYQPRGVFTLSDGPVLIEDLSTTEYPYVPQNQDDLQDQFASAWNLDSIVLPSGGSISVEYEADEYAYVQDQRAMQMFRIKGFSLDSLGVSIGNQIGGGQDFLHFEITDPAVISALDSGVDGNQILKEFYIRDIEEKYLFFKTYGMLKPSNLLNDDVYEFVPGWAEIVDYGINGSSGSYSGYVKLKKVCLKDRKRSNCGTWINPIQKALMQALRLNLPEYLYGTDNYDADEVNESAVLNTIQALGGLITQLGQFVTGVNAYMHNRDYGAQVELDRSFIRLYNPSRKKVSGTHRVRTIVMTDNFAAMTGNVYEDAIIGKRYEYVSEESTSNGTKTISSGVAAFEPMIGGEENPLYQPIPFKEELLLAPDNTQYLEEPLMGDFYPSPQIIYSRTTTRDIYSPSGNFMDLQVYENTGFAEAHHYTYKDFPIDAKRTDKKFGDPYRSPRVLELLKINSKDYYTASQGYRIYHPMMHGKPKASYVFNSSGQRISGEEQLYKTNNGKLDYEVEALSSDNALSTEIGRLGLSYSMYADTREHQNNFKTLGATGNTDVIPILAVPGPVPTIFPKYADIKKRFRSVVLVKEIRQQGILHKTVSINGPAEIVTENLLWDAETGAPIVSVTFNEFEDSIFQISIPAHLAYEQMGLVYENVGAFYNGLSSTSGIVSSTSFAQNVHVGDRISVNGSGYNEEGWVLRKNGGDTYLIDKDGRPLSFSNKTVKILESGKANQGGASVATFVTRKNPIVNGQLIIDESKMILDANVSTFKDKWQTFCSKGNTNSLCENSPEIINGDFEQGIRGFESEYIYRRKSEISLDPENNHLQPGMFTIAHHSNEAHPYWKPCSRPGHGNSMIIDGNAWVINSDGSFNLTEQGGYEYLTEPLDIWCQTISVCPNRDYSISFNGAHFARTPELQWTIDGAEIGPVITFSGEICDWETHSINWNSGSKESVRLCLINQWIELGANDFAIDDISIREIDKPREFNCSIAVQDTVNPFLKNILGNWRPHKNYLFQTDRITSDNIREDGYYFTNSDNYNKTFVNPWKVVGDHYELDDEGWTWTNENTLVSPWGNSVEARDPLLRYSTELLAYDIQKVTAVSANSKYNEVAYYGGERPVHALDNTSGSLANLLFAYLTCLPPPHLDLIDGERMRQGIRNPNSGEYFVKYTQGASKVAQFKVRNTSAQSCDEIESGPYVVQDCDCLPGFEPTEGKKYLISMWLKHRCLQSELCSETPYLEIVIDGNNEDLKDYGPVVEGWRKVEGTFEIPVGAFSGSISIKGFSGDILMDDIRIHPFDATMKTYNYDPKTLRFTYEHDDNNFFTQYGYSDDGTLQRISKQTERGIQTLQESTFSQKKTN